MRETIIGITSGAGVLVLAWLASRFRAYLARRVKVASPEAQTLAKVVPAVNALLDIQGPQTDALIALLEATQGKCNGNVDAALKTTREARASFGEFLTDSARVKEIK